MKPIVLKPQMDLKVIEYSNAIQSLLYTTSTHSNDNSNSQNSNHNNHHNSGHKSLTIPLIPCDICGKHFTKHYIQSHRRSHTGVKPFKCSYGGCDRTFTQTSSRNYHEKTHHKYSLKCLYSNCHKLFGSQIDLQKHLANHHNGIVGTGGHSGGHHSGGHSGGHSSGSSGSSLAFSATSLIGHHSLPINAEQHMYVKKRTTITRTRRVPHRSGKHGCTHCGKTFAHKISLRQHELIHGSKQFVCTYANCQYASYWKQNLSLHLRRHHNQV